MNSRTFGILTDTVLLEEKIDMERVRSVQLPISHRLRKYSPRFVRYAKPVVHTHEGIVRMPGWYKTYNPRRAR